MGPAELTRKVAEAVAPFEAVRVVWVFGSQIAGTATDRSDLDVGVVYAFSLDDEGREHARRSIVRALTESLGRLGEKADIVDLDEASSSVAFRAVAEGVRAFARSDRERVAAEARIVRRYDDDAPRRELYRRAARAHAGAGLGRS